MRNLLKDTTRFKLSALSLVLLIYGFSYCRSTNGKVNSPEKPPVLTSILINDNARVQKVPPAFKYNSFYQKYIDAQGIPIVSSEKVPDAALVQAKNIVIQMLAKIPEVKAKLIENNVRVAIMALNEKTTDIPEHSDLNEAFPETDWNTRARGLGATLVRPTISCAEENLLCYWNDPHRGEDILVHEFAHTIHQLGISYIDLSFEKQLDQCYTDAKRRNLWKYTYAISNPIEYFAKGVQCWFNVNKEAIPGDGVHNEINTREELKEYDFQLFNLLSNYFYDDDEKVSFQAGK